MGRSLYGLVAGALFVVGCAAAAPSSELIAQLGDGGVGGGGPCVDGASCSAGNPGACNVGHAVCSGEVTTCVPNVTTQSCYTGPAGTEDVGICKSGTQTCVGALGECAGQVLPAALENCFNDEDDDCDGVVNNGCPDHFVTGTAHALTAHGDPAGGSPFSLRCPANSYINKITVYGDSTDTPPAIAGVDIFCAAPTLVRGNGSYTVTVAPAVANPSTAHAGNIDVAQTFTYDCGAGFAPGWWTPGTADAEAIDRLGMHCAAAALSLSAANQLTLTLTKQGAATSAGYDVAGATPFEDDCAAGEVLVGYDGRMGNWFDQLAAVCAPLQVVAK